MHYYLDFDRTVFDTPSFKKAYAKRPSLRQLIDQGKEVVREFFSSARSISKRRLFARTLGTYLSHRRFGFIPEELGEYLYPDAVQFLTANGKNCTIVTYGVRAFITAKVTNALTEFPLHDVVYTPRKKGRTIKRLTSSAKGPFVFVDDAHFQLESVQETCPNVHLYEIRRDGHTGDGRWPIIRSFDELSSHTDQLLT